MTVKKIFLNGRPLASLRIVYAESPLASSVGSQTGRTVGEDIGTFLQGENRACDFDFQSARRLAECMEALTGRALEMVSSSDVQLKAGDILVGSVGLLTPPADERDYFCRMDDSGDYLAVSGGSFGATWHAIDALCKALENAADGSDLSDLLPIEGRAPLKTVACLGDSITRGSQALPDGNGFGTPDGLAASFGGTATSIYFEQFLSYPANLQRKLWKEYLIFNFGRGFASMRKLNGEGPVYYRETAQCEKCLAYSNRSDFSFDVVLIMLGTNDSGRDGGAGNWCEEQNEDYFNEAKRLIDDVRKGSPNARFGIMTMPHVCDCHKPSENAAAVRTLQRHAVTTLRGVGYDISCFDMGAYTAEHMGNGHGTTKEEELEIHADYYNIRTETGKPDTTHPNYRGYASIARGVEGLVFYLLAHGKAPEYLVHED